MKRDLRSNVGSSVDVAMYSSQQIYDCFDRLPAPLRHAVAHDCEDVETITVLQWWERQVAIYAEHLQSGAVTMHRLAMAAAKTYTDEAGDGYAFKPPIRKPVRGERRARRAR